MTFKKSLLLLMTIAASISSNGKTRDIASADKEKTVAVNQIFAGPWSACLDPSFSGSRLWCSAGTDSTWNRSDGF